MGSRASTVKRVVAILIAVGIVLGAGAIIGGAPALFGVNDEPSASITFEDQEGEGGNVTVAEVYTSDGGFVVVSDGAGTTLAVSEYLEAGTHENVTIEAEEDAESDLFGQLTATVHRDTTDDETYGYDETDGEEDRPYLEDGYPVSDTAMVTTTDGETLGDSFLVESMDAPSTATTNETIDVNATIRNPTENTDQQHVEFRLDGTVTERRLVEIEAGDSRNETFEVDTGDAEPGTHTIGVFTDGDGQLGELELEFDGPPALEPVEGNETAITANATLPTEGFVAVERPAGENETDDERERIGTSEGLDAGEHGNVVVDLEGAVDADEELIAVLYEGDPDEPDDATVVETEGGDPVEVAFTLEELDAASDEE